jgi:hypothetical protein
MQRMGQIFKQNMYLEKFTNFYTNYNVETILQVVSCINIETDQLQTQLIQLQTRSSDMPGYCAMTNTALIKKHFPS